MSLSIDDFLLGSKIGRGRFGHVYEVQKKDSKQNYAMKVLNKKELQDHGVLHQLTKEVEVQSKLRHKYILKLLWVFQDDKRVYIFTEIASNGNLYHFLRRLKKFPESISGKYVRQLLNSLIYIHQKKIIHRDIKPENLLLSSTGNLLLADFGWCTELMEEEGRMTICGTPEYLPPEMVTHQRYSNTVDSWTCGVLLYEFLTGVTPFAGSSPNDIYSKVVQGSYILRPEISDGAKTFISASLTTDPTKRFNAGELFLLEWTQKQDENGPSILQYEETLQSTSPRRAQSPGGLPLSLIQTTDKAGQSPRSTKTKRVPLHPTATSDITSIKPPPNRSNISARITDRARREFSPASSLSSTLIARPPKTSRDVRQLATYAQQPNEKKVKVVHEAVVATKKQGSVQGGIADRQNDENARNSSNLRRK